MRIYVASSWRNHLQPAIVLALRKAGHDVYDFRHPSPGTSGFNWREIDPAWEAWTPAQYREALKHPIAAAGYKSDIEALRSCDACVLVLPSGRSASWEFGYAMGQGKRGYVVMLDQAEPELMYREAQILTSMDEVFDVFGEPREDIAPRLGHAPIPRPGDAVQLADADGRLPPPAEHAEIDEDPGNGRFEATSLDEGTLVLRPLDDAARAVVADVETRGAVEVTCGPVSPPPDGEGEKMTLAEWVMFGPRPGTEVAHG